MSLDCYDPKPESDWAAILFASHVVESKIEEQLDKLFGGEGFVLSIWHDHYDCSLEVGFSSRVPETFSANNGLVELIEKWGFNVVYLNFADGTQQHVYCDGRIGERKVWHDNSYRWSKEKADKIEGI